MRCCGNRLKCASSEMAAQYWRKSFRRRLNRSKAVIPKLCILRPGFVFSALKIMLSASTKPVSLLKQNKTQINNSLYLENTIYFHYLRKKIVFDNAAEKMTNCYELTFRISLDEQMLFVHSFYHATKYFLKKPK